MFPVSADIIPSLLNCTLTSEADMEFGIHFIQTDMICLKNKTWVTSYFVNIINCPRKENLVLPLCYHNSLLYSFGPCAYQKKQSVAHNKLESEKHCMFKALFYQREVTFYTDNVCAPITYSISAWKFTVKIVALSQLKLDGVARLLA